MYTFFHLWLYISIHQYVIPADLVARRHHTNMMTWLFYLKKNQTDFVFTWVIVLMKHQIVLKNQAFF